MKFGYHRFPLLKRWILSIGVCLASLHVGASTHTDSLHHVLQLCRDDQSKAAILMELSIAYRTIAPDSAIHYAREVLGLTKSQDQASLRAKALSDLGTLFKRKGDYTQALEYYRRGLYVDLETKNEEGVVRDYDNIAVVLRYLGEYEQALSFHHKAINLAQTFEDPLPLSRAYANLAILYSDRTQFDLALEYFHKSLDILVNLQDSLDMARLSNNIASTYYLKQSFGEAKAYYEISLNLYQAMGYKAEQARLYNNLGNLAYEENNIDQAKEFWTEALSLANTIEDRLAQMNLHHQLGLLFLDEGSHIQAKKELEQAYQLAAELDQIEALADINPSLAEVYQELGQHKRAFELVSRSLVLKDSLQLVHSAERFSELTAMYETERTERQLAEAKHELAESRKTQILLICGGILLSLLLAIVYMNSRNHRKMQQTERKLMGQKEELNRQIIIDLLKAQEVESLNSMLEGQEQERQRIAADLHDSLGGTLAAVKVSLFTLQKKLSGESTDASKAYTHTRDLLEEAYKEVRRISHDLAGSAIEHEGLMMALDKLCATLREHSGIVVNLESSGLEQISLEGNTEIQLYRIVQELFQNIIKHARAQRVTLQISLHRDRLNLMIEDDGVGFEYEPGKGTSGIGLANIARRVKQLKGTLEIDTAPGQGTTTIIDIPT